MKIDIKVATIDDLESIQELNKKLCLSDNRHDPSIIADWPFTESGEKYFRNRIEDKAVFVAKADKQIVGYLAVSIKEVTYRNIVVGELDNIFVEEEYRKSKVGTKLIEAATNWWKSHDADKIYVNAYFNNKNAINFYKQNGFEEMDLGLELWLN